MPTKPPARNVDPSRTSLLRRAFAGVLVKRLSLLKADVVGKVLGEDALGVRTGPFAMNAGEWKLLPPAEKSKAFAAWLRTRVGARFRGASDEAVYKAFIQQGFKRGAARGLTDARRGKAELDPLAESMGKDAVLKAVMGGPAARETLDALVQRVHDDIKGLTDDLEVKLVRTLADGVVRGQNPVAIAADLSKVLEVSKERARTIARTEVIRAHADGQLAALSSQGVTDLGVSVEWTTAGKPCPRCAAHAGTVVSVEAAKGRIPHHPNCKCAWIPSLPEWVMGKSKGVRKGKVTTNRAVTVIRDGNGDAPARNAYPQHRLWSDTIQLSDWVRNVFCATGPGGGVNPHCKAGGTAAGGTVHGHSFGHLDLKTGAGAAEYLKATMASFGAKWTDSQLDKISKINPGGIHTGVFKVSDLTKGAQLEHLKNVLPAGTVIKGLTDGAIKKLSADPHAKGILLKDFPTPAGQTPHAPAAPPPKSGAASPHSHLPVVPFATETNWETGKPQPGILNGVPFAPAPPKFWEKTPDVDVGEPKATKPISRATVMIQEDDGRVWVVKPTNEFGNRKYTLPGGTNEPHLTNQQNALKEVWEETGLHVQITGHLGDFEDSNNGRTGRTYIGKRIGGAPWDAKIESSIVSRKTGKAAAESETVSLVTKERAAELLHRTDDLAQLAAVAPIPLETKTGGQMIKKLLDGIEPAAKAYKDRKTAAGEKAGNAELHVIQNLRGFNNKPKLVSKKEMDDLVKAGGHTELLRGIDGVGYGSNAVTGKKLAEQFRTGDHFPGHGIFGSGTYADSNKGSKNVVGGRYGKGGTAGIIRMALPKTAKVISAAELEKKVPAPPPNWTGYAYAGGKSTRECWLGVQAALAGYDAIHVDKPTAHHFSYGVGFHVVLNRSILVVQKEDAKGHKIQ